MEFEKYKINDFINELSGDLSSPGGGSTAALVAALASSLNSMVYSFTIDKKSYQGLDQQVKEKMIKLDKDGKDFTKLALNFMERDREDFMLLMDCFKLPKETQEEIQFRKDQIKEKTIKAMNTPFDLAKTGLELYDNIEFDIEYGNKNLTSDGVVAAILLHSAIEAAVVNVLVNYNSLKADQAFTDIPVKCREIITESNKRKEKITKSFGM